MSSLPQLEVIRVPAALAAWQGDLSIAALPTALPHLREEARFLTRTAIKQLLGERFGCAPASLCLKGIAGAPLRLVQAPASEPKPGLSVSHEMGLSAVVVNFAGKVGIDLLRLDAVHAASDELLDLARTFLGPDAAESLSRLSSAERVIAFACRWSAFEASLKCLERGLEEWSPHLDLALKTIETGSLDLFQGYVGCLAVACRGAE